MVAAKKMEVGGIAREDAKLLKARALGDCDGPSANTTRQGTVMTRWFT
jgi:hypothetical protein